MQTPPRPAQPRPPQPARPMNLECPHCRSALQVDASRAGERASCPHCNGVFDVPVPSASLSGAASPRGPVAARNDGPGKVLALGIMAVCGGAMAAVSVLIGLAASLGFVLLWPGTYVAIATAILALIHGIPALQDRRRPIPKYVAILQIICIVNCDVINLVLGIVELVFMNDPQVVEFQAGYASDSG